MAALPITLACGSYDRTLDLQHGRVPVEGVDLRFLPLPAEETFFRMLAHAEFDVAEMSLSSYVLSLREPRPRFVAIPVFPSRAFRHSCVWTHTPAGITDPAQLAGRVVGIPEYQMTAAVWLRGILAEHHGLPVDAPRYRTGGLHQPGRTEKLRLTPPPGVDVKPIGPGETLAQMLVTGEIDALYTARAPATARTAPDRVRRLFPDAASRERDYARRTGIFPIMHTVVIRREVYEANRWLAQTLVVGFTEARDRAYRRLADTTALATTLPWQIDAVEEAAELLGEDWWPYGLPPNRHVLATFLRYSHDQGLAGELLRPEDLFAPETLAGHAV